MPVILDQNSSCCVIRLDGDVGVSAAAELKQLLLQYLTSERELRVDLERTTELSISALQLLWAAEQESKALGVSLRRVGLLPEAVATAARDAGFETFPIPADSTES